MLSSNIGPAAPPACQLYVLEELKLTHGRSRHESTRTMSQVAIRVNVETYVLEKKIRGKILKKTTKRGDRKKRIP